jgi:hypothetical protein
MLRRSLPFFLFHRKTLLFLVLTANEVELEGSQLIAKTWEQKLKVDTMLPLSSSASTSQTVTKPSMDPVANMEGLLGHHDRQVMHLEWASMSFSS